jgi:hypothetical protein
MKTSIVSLRRFLRAFLSSGVSLRFGLAIVIPALVPRAERSVRGSHSARIV